jgi:outer membrane protein OmpA-like peptidoglycan-associated protein
MRIALGLLATTSVAHADATELGAFVGPRIFAKDQMLGYLPDAPAHPSLGNSVMFGGRIARPLFPWLVPELELALAPTSTNAEAGAGSADVFWIDPRVHMRFQFNTDKQLQPFVVIGGGSPIALSSARMTFDSGIVGSAYIGGGLRFDTNRGFAFRFDARVAFVPGSKWVDKNDEGQYVKAELDINLGIELQLGRKRKAATKEGPVVVTDDDKDGIANAKDACIDRAEDADGFDDLDGCPDIDNDTDRVLDIADKCGTVPETMNGFQDDDGCPDTLPAEVDALRGTVEGLLYAEAETAVRDSAIPNIQKIAKTMTTHPSIRVVLIGHADDQEAKQFAEPAGGQAAPDIAQVAIDLSRARAEAVRQVLVANGIADGRIVVEGRGSEEPVSDNDKPKGRLANRRVEIKLFVPPR